MKRKLINRGIDPNNHRLIRNPLLKCGSSASSYNCSKDNKNIAKNNEPTKSNGDDNYNYEQVSDIAASSDLEEQSFCLPDLNLDLTMSNNVASGANDQNPIVHESQASNELLFR